MVKFIKENKLLIGAAIFAYLLLSQKTAKAKGSITLPDYTWNDSKTDYMLLPTTTSYEANATTGKISADPLGLNFVIIESAKNKNIFHALHPDDFRLFFDYKGKLPTDK